MIVFLTITYIVILAIFVKLKIIKLTLWWKLSPLVWMTVLLIVLFIPMQFWAPAGRALVVQYSVSIVPNVTGQVIKVPVKPNVNIKKGDVLFKLDPTIYIAARDQVKAQLELARIRLEQTQSLRTKDAVSLYELEQYQAQVKQFEAMLVNAEYNLEQTVVKAPADGFVTNLALRPGARVASFPISQVMAFVENSERLIVTQIAQGFLRHVKPGLHAEVTFKLFPGKIYKAKVDYVIRASATGQVIPSGQMVAPRDIVTAPYGVRLRLENKELMNNLPAGAAASVAIYSSKGKATHLIRKVMIRMDAYMNFIIPF